MRMFGRNEYPGQWYCQMTHYLAVTGADKAYLAVLISGSEFRIFELERNEEEIEALMRIEERFWQHVQDDTPPEATAQDTEAVESYLGGAETRNDTPIDLTPDVALLREYAEAKAQADEADAKVKELKNRICVALGEYETGTAEGYRVTWKSSTRNTLDAKALQAAYPKLDLAPFYKATTSRRFDFKAVKAAE